MFFCLILFFSLFLTGCGSTQKVTQTVYALDTVITLTIYEPDKASLLEEAAKKIADYENKFSRTISGSEIDQINKADGSFVTVSDDTASLLSEALKYCALTDGKMDITISPAKDLWDFTGETKALPDADALAEAVTHVDYTGVEISKNQVRLTDPDAALDLGCIAKGYIADQIRSFLMENGISAGILNFGGNVVCFGSKPDGTPYKIGIQKPFDKTGAILTSVDAKEDSFTSVVTSGIYERYFELDGQIYHHILDSKTGYPVENDLYSVTILSDSSTQGDALSTTCLALGLTDGMKLIEDTEGVEAIFVTKDDKLHTTY